jgi:hypothetical protein
MLSSRMFTARFKGLAASTCIGLMIGVGCVANVAADDVAPEETVQEAAQNLTAEEKKIIGPVMILAEAETELEFRARIDTGATTTSIHVEEFEIENESPDMKENVGKKIRFRLKNHLGESDWLERKIKGAITVKTSAKEQNRYKVPMELRLNDITKKVDVTLNDRSHMTYELLLGRNFLKGDFLVDVDMPQNVSAVVQVAAIEKDEVDNDTEETTEDTERPASDGDAG